ncbi:MAG: RelA/SpoT family protein [Candidatus Gracilibacteria bacterium]|nr:RelA/SpoT family protein [Candidatus Gracilibacteria bacterium]
MYDYSKIDKKVEKIIKSVAVYMTYSDKKTINDEIYKAYYYARDAHEGQFRQSGDPYIIHPVEAVGILVSLKPDLDTIQACFLHDVIEDTPKTKDDIEKNFGKQVALLCSGMEKLSKVKYRGEDRNVGSLRKMFVAMAEDLRVIFIKLSDRLHNMQTLRFHPSPEKRERIALETLNIYIPIADRLGLFQLKNALEEECFRNLEPDDYKKLSKELREMRESMESFSHSAEKEIKKVLEEGGINKYEVDYRIKSIYSIYKKMQKKGLDSAKSLYDLFGIRIMVKNETQCYKVLGLIHKKWTPLPNRFKDYIALPKPNGYKSLHTTVIGLLKDFRKQPTEIQIKTFKMKEAADIGVAAHFEYKERGSKVAEDIYWVKELKELTESLENNDFIDSLKIDVFKDRIFVFTPKGDLINLPSGSTPIDFAYYVHSELGDHISVVRINGTVRTLDKELHNGDVIEIVTDKNKKPNPFWLSFVKTTKAKNRIRSYLKKDDKELFRERGKDILNKYFEKASMPSMDKEMSVLKNIDGKNYTIEERCQILEQIGNFSITPASVFKRILKYQNKLTVNKGAKEESEGIIEEDIGRRKIVVGGEENLEYKIGNCCKRKIPKRIVAHINGKGIITIHKRDCKVIETVNKDRLLSAYLPGDENEYLHVDIIFTVLNKKGVLKNLSDIIYAMDINIDGINFNKTGKIKGDLVLTLEIPDYDYLILDRLVERVKNNLGHDLVGYQIKNLK